MCRYVSVDQTKIIGIHEYRHLQQNVDSVLTKMATIQILKRVKLKQVNSHIVSEAIPSLFVNNSHFHYESLFTSQEVHSVANLKYLSTKYLHLKLKEQSDVSLWECAGVLKSSVVYQFLPGKRNFYIHLLGKGKIDNRSSEVCEKISICNKTVSLSHILYKI